MADMFSDLSKFGLGDLNNVDIFAAEHKKQEEAAIAAKQPKPLDEADMLLDKTYTCPVCDRQFKAKQVKAGKAKLVKVEIDLRAKYEGIDMYKYGAILCDNCGYCALTNYFDSLSDFARGAIKEKISKKYLPSGYNKDIMTYDEAITRHQLALVNAVVKNARASEKAYICLKTSWLISNYIEELMKGEEDNQDRIAKLKEQRASYEKNAYEGFVTAMANESGNICGMDKWTLTYLVAYLALKSGDRNYAAKALSDVLVARDAKESIKDKARTLKELLAK